MLIRVSEREYQQKLMKSKSKIVMCDWDRGKGKTHAIANFINEKIDVNERINILVVTRNPKETSIILQDKIEDMVDCNKYEVRGVGFEKIMIDDRRGYIVATISITQNIENYRGAKFDYVLCDEYIPSSNQLSIFYHSGAKQVCILGTFDIDYITDKEEINEDEWIDNQIKELMQEFSSIPKVDNTTKRREVVLYMINRLNDMRSSAKEPVRHLGSGLFGNKNKETSGIFGNKTESSGLFK